MRKRSLFFLPLLVMGAAVFSQPVITDVFPPAEYAGRRARLMERIGDAVAIMQGTTERPGEQALRQSNQFFYITGVNEPRALLIIDGRLKKSTLFLNPRNERRETMMFGPGLLSRRSGRSPNGHGCSSSARRF